MVCTGCVDDLCDVCGDLDGGDGDQHPSLLDILYVLSVPKELSKHRDRINRCNCLQKFGGLFAYTGCVDDLCAVCGDLDGGDGDQHAPRPSWSAGRQGTIRVIS
jgi:hypothetical protein